MIRIIKYILGFTWLGVVAYFYYTNHNYYHFDLPGLVKWWPLWVLPLIGYGGALLWHWTAGKQNFQFKLSFLRIIGVAFLSMLFVGSMTMFISNPLMYKGPEAVITYQGEAIFNPSQEQINESAYHFEYGTTLKDTFNLYKTIPSEIQQNLYSSTFFGVLFGLSWTFIKVYGSALLLLFFAWLTGSTAHEFLRRKKEKDTERPFEKGILETILGLGFISTLLFLLAAIGQFNLPVILGAIVIITAALYRQVLKNLKALFSWHEKFEINITSIAIPIFLFLGLIMCIHMFDNLSPLPRGWDGLNRYIVIAKDLANGGDLLKRGSVYGWELILGFFYLIDIKMTLAWTSIPGVLTFLVMWPIARRYSSNLGTALALTTIAVMPMMSFHISDENKVDVAHWLIGTASILALIKAISFENGLKIKDHSYLWIAGLLAGYAFTVKFTAAILIVTLLSAFSFVEGGIIGLIAAGLVSIGVLATSGGIGFGTEFTTPAEINPIITAVCSLAGLIILGFGVFTKKVKKNALRTLVILILCIFIPIAPWFVKNAVETRLSSASLLITGTNDIPEINFNNDTALCKSTAFYEEYDRYIGYNSNVIFRVLELPWHLTMNDTGAIGAYVDMGFTFLGFILLGFLLYKPSKQTNYILLFGGLYFFFWLIKANGVSWYGFPFFSFMAVFLAVTYTNMSKDWIGRIGLIFFLGIWFLSGFDARLNNYAKPGLLLTNSGTVKYDDVRESVFPYSNELNAFLSINDGLIYKIGTPMGYFIPDYVKRTFDDQLLDTFNCNAINSVDNEEIRHKLRDLGFKFILYDAYTYTVGIDPEGTLKAKIDLFEKFAKEQLIVVIFDDKRGHHLFYIPTDAELNNEVIADLNIPEM
ncbi:glycosyltransferase family 39 protein [Patescibacteria group bacterium]|nr:glycosyltransferase family 39 protein [Patescibacteria group bacterium]